jgi:hypothetical protein
MKRKSNLTKLLQELTKEELIDEIEKICDKFEVVKDYFQIDLTGDTSAYVEQVRKKIAGQFHTAKGKRRNPKASRLNKIITDFEIISIYKEDIISLLLYRVAETGLFADKYDYLLPALLQSNIRAFARACTMIDAEGAQEKYKEQCAAICRQGRAIYFEGELDNVYFSCFNETPSAQRK